ncbi:MAG: hypothetical protein IPM56_14500 [Ignavibacteriales bacterium]|nr:MAG: hypothetical protein IPM56_14500 [Ignavibacteriales bacterium]
MIRLILSVSLLLMLAGCNELNDITNPADGKLHIQYKNNSGYDLKNLNVGGIAIGNVSDGSLSSDFIYNQFTFDTGMPDEDAVAEVNGKTFSNINRGYWCGTEKVTISSGNYLIEVAVLDTMLYLSCKNAPTIDYH